MIERESVGEDVKERFGRGQYFEHIANQLILDDKQTATGLVVGLTGPWGTGKSQALFFIEDILNKKITSLKEKHGENAKPILVVRFNPWLHSGRDSLLKALFEIIFAAVKVKSEEYEKLKKIYEKKELKKLLEKVTPYIDFIKQGVGKLIEEFTDESLEKVKAEILEKFTEAEISVVVLVDEIDRLSDDEIKVMAQVIKSVADFRIFSYLLAYDPERVAKALGGNDEKLGHYYLEKIIQVQCRLPRIDPSILIEFAEEKILPIITKTLNERGCYESKSKELLSLINEIFKFLIPEILSTPRDIFRVASSYAIRLPMAYSEVDAIDLLRFCALETQVPLLSEKLQLLATRISVDGVRELNRRLDTLLDADECIDTILRPFENNEHFRDLLIQLFPALRKGDQDFITRDDRRLCYETPLLFLLNFGNLPGMITYEKAEEALKNPENSLEKMLYDAVQNNRLRHTVLRLRTTACALELSEDQISKIWKVFAKFFDRPFKDEDLNLWSQWQELTHVFVRGAMKGFLPRSWLKPGLIQELLDEGCIHLPATLLVFHMQTFRTDMETWNPSLNGTLSYDDFLELNKLAAVKLTDSIVKQDKWFLRSINPIKVIFLGSSNKEIILDNLISKSNNPFNLYALLILCLRTRHEQFKCIVPRKGEETLVDERFHIDEFSDESINLFSYFSKNDCKKLLENWKNFRTIEIETRSPFGEAYKYFENFIRYRIED